MQAVTAQALVEINRRFYAGAGADAFDRSRTRSWRGFEGLLPTLPARRPLRVLDAGCGNGRFGAFLQAAGVALDYTGLDTSPRLLRRARRALSSATDTRQVRTLTCDLCQGLPATVPAQRYDCVAAIALLHHIPGRRQRDRLLSELARRVAPGGVLVVTAWRFDRVARVARHRVPWTAHPLCEELGIDPADLEPGDQLVLWAGDPARPRYCHLLGPGAFEVLGRYPGLQPQLDYAADGPSGDYNRYLVYAAG